MGRTASASLLSLLSLVLTISSLTVGAAVLDADRDINIAAAIDQWRIDR